MALPLSRNLLAVDWGTSSLRGAWLDASGRVIEERSLDRGILTVPSGQFASVFAASFDPWTSASDAICLISGMAGSRQGWIEAPYCPCPAGFDEIAAKLTWIEPDRIAIVPGLCDEHEGVPDVMRGEETQIFGAMALQGASDGTFVLPGTHSKWATVADGRVTRFRTFMTGEFYALLARHSILARTLVSDAVAAALDESAFLEGIAHAARRDGLLHNAFAVRTLALFERKSAAALASYLSGLLIGEELERQQLEPNTEVVLIGARSLTHRYALALAARGVRSTAMGSEATWAGLHALAQRIA